MKRAKKYFALFLLAGLIFMISNPSVSAQNRQRKDGCKFLTEEQQGQAKVIKAKYHKDLTYFQNKLNELNAQQKTLIQVDKPNLKSLYANIEAKTELQNKIAKTRTKMHIELRSIMTEEQRLMMGSGMGKKMMARRGMHKRMGNKNMCGANKGRHQMHRGQKQGNCNGCSGKEGIKMHKKGDCNSYGKGHHKGMHQRGERSNCHGDIKHNKKGTCGSGCKMNLTEEQQATFKNLRLEKLRTVNPLKNNLKELQAKKHTLMTAEKINSREIYKIIDQMSDIKEKIAKANIKQKIEMRKHLTEEQKLMFNKNMHGRSCHVKF